MAMFTTYYDTSGSTAEHPVIVTSGIVASERKWTAFESHWKKMLRAHRVPYLHMKELPKQFKGREAEKLAFLLDAITVIRRHTSKRFAVSLAVEEYHRQNYRFALEETFGCAFALCAGICALLANHWTARTQRAKRIAHLHEGGERGWGHLRDFLASQEIELTPKFKKDPATREWFLPFQANDLLAWEDRRGYMDIVRGLPLRRDFQAEVLRLDIQRVHLTRTDLPALLDRWRVQRRR